MTMMTAIANEPKKITLSTEFKHERPLTSCLWHPTQKYVFFGAEDHQVHRFDVTSKQAAALTAHSSWVRALGTSADGEVLYSGGYDGRLTWWNATADQPEPIRVLDAHKGWIRAMAVSPDGRMIATCGNDLLIRLWDAAQGTLLNELTGHASHIYNVIFTPDGSRLVSCDLKGIVRIWNRTADNSFDGAELATIAALHKYDETFRADIGGARSIALSADGRQLALGGITNVTNAFAGIGEVVVVLLDLDSGKVIQQLETKAKTKGTAWGVDWHPGQIWVGCSGGGGGGWLTLWKGDAQHEYFGMKLKSDGRGMSLSRDGKQVAVAHADRHIRIYDLLAEG